MGITAQVSIYPLRQESLTPAIKRALEIFQKHRLEMKPGPMSTLVLGDDSVVFTALIGSALSVAVHRLLALAITNRS